MKKIFFSACLVTCMADLYAQTDTIRSDTAKRGKLFEHHIGVQMNELIRQVFNFNNATTATTLNPYLLTYNINFFKSGWGLRTGVGYTHQSFASDDGVTKNVTNVDNIHARIGIEKRFQLSHRWKAGIGADAVYANEKRETNTVIRTTDSTTTNIASTEKAIGGGAMGWLRYYITERIAIGTETSFYYTAGKQEQTITITARNNSIPNRPYRTTTSMIDNKNEDGSFRMPVVFYLLIRF